MNFSNLIGHEIKRTTKITEFRSGCESQSAGKNHRSNFGGRAGQFLTGSVSFLRKK